MRKQADTEKEGERDLQRKKESQSEAVRTGRHVSWLRKASVLIGKAGISPHFKEQVQGVPGLEDPSPHGHQEDCLRSAHYDDLQDGY